MKRRINVESLIQFCIFIGLAVLIIPALISGTVREYVHPRMDVYLWFAVAAFIVIGIFTLSNLFKPRRGLHLLPYLLIVIPMVTAYAMPAATFDNAAANVQRVVLPQEKLANSINKNSSSTLSLLPDSGYAAETTASPEPARNLSEATGSPYYDSQTMVEPTAPAQDKTFVAQADKNGIIEVADTDYVQWYTDLKDDPNKYEGKAIKVKGQVFRMDGFAKDEFVPVRMSMFCCVADLEPVGFLCKYKDAQKWADNAWVYVTATVHMGEYGGDKMPILYATELAKAEKPKDEYVYFPY